MNFTKEYIKECEDKRIQELKPKVEDFVMGDWFYNIAMKLNPIFIIGRKDKAWCREEIIWLPTGDQLDDEIVEICEELKYSNFSYDHIRFDFAYRRNPLPNSIDYIYSAKVSWFSKSLEDWNGIDFRCQDNPLLAKIKLLKALLKP